jgi:pyridinium-3,5-biscarboxylic acid mononucleotide sulfurtransferase
METMEADVAVLQAASVETSTIAKWQALVAELGSYPSAVVAYSGGVDSCFLAFAAARVLGERMVALTVVSPVEPADILAGAARFAAEHGFRHDTIQHDPLENAQYRANPADRCYHCKTIILGDLWKYARTHGIQVVLEGQNADDRKDYRPGAKAVTETGTFSPLARNNLAKAEIRALAKAFGLSVWNQPSSPCLASRIPYGTEITRGALDRIFKAESYLHGRGFEVVRVRYYQDMARIEVAPERIPALLAIREDLLKAFKEIGFLYTTVDLQGYRLGSLNEGLAR